MGDEANLSLVQSVCLRPGMYTLSGSFVEVVCFLEGYSSGLSRNQSPPPWVKQWNDLTKRLSSEMTGEAQGGGWQAGFIALRGECPDDRTAIERLAYLFIDSYS